MEKAALRAIKHLFPLAVASLSPGRYITFVPARSRDFELNLKSDGRPRPPILRRPGVKCRSVAVAVPAGLIGGVNSTRSDDGAGRPSVRRRTVIGLLLRPWVAIQDAEDRSIPFSIWSPRGKARMR